MPIFKLHCEVAQRTNKPALRHHYVIQSRIDCTPVVIVVAKIVITLRQSRCERSLGINKSQTTGIEQNGIESARVMSRQRFAPTQSRVIIRYGTAQFFHSPRILIARSRFFERNTVSPVHLYYGAQRTLRIGNTVYGLRKDMTVKIAIKRPVKRILIVVYRSLLLFLPRTCRAESHAIPSHVEKVFTHVVPVAAKHALRAIFFAVSHEISDIDEVRIKIREYSRSPKSTRSHKKRDFVSRNLRKIILIIATRQIIPSHSHRIIRKHRKINVFLVLCHVSPK